MEALQTPPGLGCAGQAEMEVLVDHGEAYPPKDVGWLAEHSGDRASLQRATRRRAPPWTPSSLLSALSSASYSSIPRRLEVDGCSGKVKEPCAR